MNAGALVSYLAPAVAAASAIGALIRWYVVDRRKSQIETRVTEKTMPAEIDLHDTGARDARLVYVQRQVDMERTFHVQQIADRDAEIARQRAELAHRDEIISSLLREVDRLQLQLAQMSRDMDAVQLQLRDLSTHSEGHRDPELPA